MAFVLYEIWIEDKDGHQELFMTAANLPEAKRLADKAAGENLMEQDYCAIVYEATDDDAVEVIRFKKS